MSSSSTFKHEVNRKVHRMAAINNEGHGSTGASVHASVHASAGAVPPATSGHERLEGTLSHKNVTFIFVIAVVLSLAIFIATYCIAYMIWCTVLRPRERNPHDYAYTSRTAAATVAAVTMEAAERGIAYGGLEAALVSSFPILEYSAGKETKGAAHLQRIEECAVCLSEFEAGEEMKVLPVCGHGFHKACIDRWLLSHVTCPICRLSLLKRMQGSHGNNSR